MLVYLLATDELDRSQGFQINGEPQQIRNVLNTEAASVGFQSLRKSDNTELWIARRKRVEDARMAMEWYLTRRTCVTVIGFLTSSEQLGITLEVAVPRDMIDTGSAHHQFTSNGEGRGVGVTVETAMKIAAGGDSGLQLRKREPCIVMTYEARSKCTIGSVQAMPVSLRIQSSCGQKICGA